MSPSPSNPPVAEETRLVKNPYLGITQRVLAGQPIPPDLVEAYASGETVKARSITPNTTTPGEFDVNTASKKDLEAEAKRRELTITGTGSQGNVTKEDLQKALAPAPEGDGDGDGDDDGDGDGSSD